MVRDGSGVFDTFTANLMLVKVLPAGNTLLPPPTVVVRKTSHSLEVTQMIDCFSNNHRKVPNFLNMNGVLQAMIPCTRPDSIPKIISRGRIAQICINKPSIHYPMGLSPTLTPLSPQEATKSEKILTVPIAKMESVWLQKKRTVFTWEWLTFNCIS